jgi:hypothetical protein
MQKALYFVCLLLTGYSLSFGQAKLAIDSTMSVPPDSLFFLAQGDSIIEYTVVVVNNGNAAVNGAISVRAYHNADYSVWYEKAEFVVNNFEVGQSQTITFNDTVRTIDARYKGGNNILVIWPHSDAPNIQVPDSSNADIWIDGLVGVKDPTVFFARVEAGPNPVSSGLNLRYLKDQHKLEYVRIMNTSGQILRQYDKAVSRIEFDMLPPGLYLLEIKYRDGVAGTYRILRSN